MKFSTRGFTLVELMIVMAIIGILSVALFPAFSNYIQRGRDTARLSDIDTLSKALTLYFSEKDSYPLHDQGCVSDVNLSNFIQGTPIHDPQTLHSNGCDIVGRYAYAMSTGILANPNVYSLLAIMEQPLAGNYSGSLLGFTGTLTPSAYNTGLLYTVKGTGPSYIRVP